MRPDGLHVQYVSTAATDQCEPAVAAELARPGSARRRQTVPGGHGDVCGSHGDPARPGGPTGDPLGPAGSVQSPSSRAPYAQVLGRDTGVDHEGQRDELPEERGPVVELVGASVAVGAAAWQHASHENEPVGVPCEAHTPVANPRRHSSSEPVSRTTSPIGGSSTRRSSASTMRSCTGRSRRRMSRSALGVKTQPSPC